MNKQIKKIVSVLIPKGKLKDIIKVAWYNLFSEKAKYGLKFGDKKRYTTKVDGVELTTTDPLYNIVADFDHYTHFYKIKNGDRVIDAGANNGYISLYFAHLAGADGRVFAIEPDRINAARIMENIVLNQRRAGIEIFDILLWDKEEEVDFYEAGTVGSSAHWIPDRSKVTRKQAITLDAWATLNNVGRIDFIKMDIEGAEIEAIEGCVETIMRDRPNFAIASYHIINGEPTYKKMESFFDRLSYPYKTVRFKGGEIITFAGDACLS